MTEAEYLAALQELQELAAFDPAPDSADGRRLIELADAVEAYEQGV